MEEEMELHDICVLAAGKMVADGIVRHVSWIDEEDDYFDCPKGKVVKLTVEFVDEDEPR